MPTSDARSDSGRLRSRAGHPGQRWRPASTYRLQMHRGFTFDDARAASPYLARLGVDALYFSPYLRARPESTHGYDVSNHHELNPALGGETAFERLTAEMKRLGLGHLLDVVPNHMGIGEPSNVWWMDVLENGPSSIYADYFDVNWDPVKEDLRDRVLLPILGDQYGRVLENGELRVAFEDGAFSLWYYETMLPLSPRSYVRLLEPALARLRPPDAADPVLDDPALTELESIATAARNLPTSHERDPERRRERHREKEVVKRRLATVAGQHRPIAAAIEAAVGEINGVRGEPATFDRLDELLGRQSYRLAYWRVASEEINYRRFFDVNDLAAIRMENPEVFAATHRLILRLVGEGVVDGLRIDHPDGLWDPARYFAQLQEAAGRPLYVAIEKILTGEERLPAEWDVDGTVGYEYLNALNGLFVDPASRRRLTSLYDRVVGERVDVGGLTYQSKTLIMQVALASEVNVLALLLDRISERIRRYRDFTLYALRSAVRETIACFPVYRTYLTESTEHVSASDRAHVEIAIGRARRRNPATDASILAFVRDVLLLRLESQDDPDDSAALRRFVMKFQQTTGPVAAKGVEDTAFYVYNRLVSLNEVGGEPDRFGTGVEAFHRLNAHRQERWAGGLSTTSTHDTKRSEDVRARIDVLSELPGEWVKAVAEWSRLNRTKGRLVGDHRAPDRNEEYLLYQTLVGVWPLDPFEGEARAEFAARVVAYMRKATKEAKVNTSWISPDEEWDAALTGFVEAALADDAFVASMLPFQRRVAHYGMYNALSQTLLKLASPGVPDVYQGQEVWDFSMVDPDNRRPVDYRHRAGLLDRLARDEPRWARDPGVAAAELLECWRDGRIKLWLTHRGLALRRRRRALFADGAYLPLVARGERAESVVAFARVGGEEAAIAIAPRLIARLTADPARPPIGPDVWGDTTLRPATRSRSRRLPPGRYQDQLTGVTVTLETRGELRLAEALAHLPIALLERVE